MIDALGEGTEGWSEGERVCVFPFKPLDHHDLEVAMSSGIGLGQIAGAYAEAIVVDTEILCACPRAWSWSTARSSSRWRWPCTG